MEHSVDAHLGRQPTAALQGALMECCMTEGRLRSNAEAVRLILKELRKRHKEENTELPPYVQQAWERYQQHMAELEESIK